MSQRKSTSDRYRYGLCLNDDCPKCKAKEVQQISVRKEFVCEECGSELRECPPPKKKNFKPLIIALILLLICGGVVCFVVLKPKKEKKVEPQQPKVEIPIVEQPMVEPQGEEEPVVEEPKQEPKKATSGNSLSYGNWTGEWKNGKPHGTGTMTYTKSTLIDKRDPQQRTADKGDYIVGEFYDGKLVQGRWFDKQNNLKGSIMIGR